MCQPLPHGSPIAVRARIRATARIGRYLQRAGTALLFLLPVGWSLWRHGAGSYWRRVSTCIEIWDPPPWARWLHLQRWPLAGEVLLLALCLIGGGALYWRLRRAELRRDMAGMAPTDRGALLLPLCQERGATRRLARALLADARIGTEVTPAPTPTGRGDEPTP
jgi:hypothetical protein